MKLPYYQVDAFASAVFRGNPAGVCPLPEWVPDATMQSIALENNQAETAFFVPRPTGSTPAADFDLRWFTPVAEVDLCGHATLASAHIVFTRMNFVRPVVSFHTRSGVLTVRRDGEGLAMDFPSRPPTRCETPAALIAALGRTPRETWQSRDLMAVFDTEEEVRALNPDMAALTAMGGFGNIATAPGRDGVDFVSRFFAPAVGVPEDPATGSSHCTLTPYWAKRLGKSKLNARQISKRVGEMRCEDLGERVSIAGRVAVYLEGTIEV